MGAFTADFNVASKQKSPNNIYEKKEPEDSL